MKNKETQLVPSPLELYHKMHFHQVKGWLKDESRIQYERVLHTKEELRAKLVSAGTNITLEMEDELEKKAIKSVCIKRKTLLSGWEVSSGPVMRKKRSTGLLSS